MSNIKTYETGARLFVGGMEREFPIYVRYSYWPAVRPSQTNDAESARVEIHKVTARIRSKPEYTLALGKEPIEFDLMPIMDADQFESLENEIKMLEEEQ